LQTYLPIPYILALKGEDIRNREISLLFFLRDLCELDKVRIMNRLQAYKFQLKTTAGIEFRMWPLAGSCQFGWNRAFALQQERYQVDRTPIRYNDLAGLRVEWKKDFGTAFLATVHSQILQQTLKDLERAWSHFFQKRAERPRFKKKGRKERFRFPQGFKLDQANSRIDLPKLGWVLYRNSRQVDGTPKQVTVSKELDRWYISVQTKREVEPPKHPAKNDIGRVWGLRLLRLSQTE
jgi:putative transposase